MYTLKITHNSGFFSCVSKKLEAVAWFFDTYKRLPDTVDGREQFALYKSDPSQDITSMCFKERGGTITYEHPIHFHTNKQFIDYRDLNLNDLKPFAEKYFSPSDTVAAITSRFEKKYTIDYANTCAVLYRGNDKSIETKIAPYEAFISRAKMIKEKYPSVRFLVQTDEAEFLETFQKEVPNSFHIEEIPRIPKQKSTVLFQLPTEERPDLALDFLAAVFILSQSRHLITHSGNIGMWTVLYRGNCDNVHQWLDNSWDRSPLVRWIIRMKLGLRTCIRKIIKRKKSAYWQVVIS